MAIQIGKYKRPGIFIEEFDNSVITSPVVNGISSMVIGFSRKGPVNTPVLVQNTNDLDSIFGSIDRNLERKGNFFHRTVSKMLESSPVYAINLLLTDDTLDTIEYESMSTSSSTLNDTERLGAYRRFFDTTGFWKRDTDSFINLTKNNVGYGDRLLNLTNLSDRFITTFIFKTKVKGFDRTLIEWYGSVEKMPMYVNQTDYASDYMVDVVVVGGDWSNYSQLAIDPRWSQYFSPEGLQKDQVYNFANDRNITLLAFYEGLSLIPYFRDANNRNIFIETTINQDTDRTGLFCAFNNDLFETDFPNGKVDLIGNNLVGSEQSDINFLSYGDTIVEAISYTVNYLDKAGNVSSLGTSYKSSYIGDTTRTSFYSEGYVNGITLLNAVTSASTQSISFTYSVAQATNLSATPVDAYGVIGGEEVPVISGTTSFVIVPSSYPGDGTFSSVVVLDTTGSIVKYDNLLTSSGPSVAATDVVLGQVSFSITGGAFVTSSVSFTNITVGPTASGSYINLTYGSTNSSDYYISNVGTTASAILKVEFWNTAVTPSTSNYSVYRKIKMFNHLVSLLDSANKDKMLMVTDTTLYTKVSLSGMTISDIITSTTANKSFNINTNLPVSDLTDVLAGDLLLYTVDDELILGTDTMLSKSSVATTSEGVIGKYSEFYTDFVSGSINSGDYFYSNLIAEALDISFINDDGGIYGTAGYSYISITGTPAAWPVSPTAEFGDTIIVPDSVLNPGTFTLDSSTDYGTSSYVYRLSEDVVDEDLTDITIVYNYGLKHYLQMYLDSSNDLSAAFMDVTLTTSEPVDVSLNQTFKVQSALSNFKQTIEIEVPTGYTQVDNKILVVASRYTELKVGDFLEAYVDPLITLEVGEVAKKLTRILSKKLYAADTTLVEVSCDAKINKVTYGTDLQTTRYTTIEDYVSTYKAISLKGFRIREASLPDGTETRQNAILNLVAKGTPIFKAITNKEALDFRYLVDSFGLGLVERSKQQLVDICGDRLDAVGFINMPSMKSFKNSSSPSFVDADGVLQLEFVASGGDPESNPAFLYTFGDGKGVSSVGYFLPYLTVNDNGRPLDVPPAMFVASTYMRKQITNVSSITPWTIAAGTTNGKITGITSIEMDFTPTDIEYLNQAQMNPIVFKRNRGYIIETENTGQTLYKSALSYLHTREVLIELERELSRMLLDFQWKFNTNEIRAEIKLRADTICEQYVNKKGLYNYFNKCDEENNTSEVIDNQIGVLDTYVEPIKGMGIIVNNITILRTGAIQSGGFIS